MNPEMSSEEVPAKKSVKSAAAKKPAKVGKAAKEAPESAGEAAQTHGAEEGRATKAAKVEKAPAKAKGKKPAKAEGEPELLFSSDRDDAPEAPAPQKAPERDAPETVAEAAPQAARPFTFKVVGDEPATKPADSGKRHEAVEFDPSAIFARFAPKADAPKADAPKAEPAAEAPAKENISAERNPESGAEPEAGEAGRAPGETSGEAAPRQNPQARNPQQQGQQQRHPNDRQGQQNRQGGQNPQQGQRHPNDRQGQNGNGGQRHPNDRGGQQNQQGRGGNPKFQQGRKQWPGLADTDTAEEHELALGEAFNYNALNDPAVFEEQEKLLAGEDVGEPFDFNALYGSTMNDIVRAARDLGVKLHRTPQRRELVGIVLDEVGKQKRPIRLTGTLELLEDGNGLLVYGFDNYRVRDLSAFIPKLLIRKCGLLRGHEVEALAFPARAGETAPMVVKVLSVMGAPAEEVMQRTPFTELTAYYPTKRMMLETENTVGWDNLSMRCVDLLCPIGLGQRGLIVAPPRTGKTVLMQAIANSIARNNPEVHLMVLLVDERPEEVTDFRRNTKANEVVSSTFDENAESHVHAAEMVIERARRMVEGGRHVVILLDSITRLARAYNTMVPSTGKILSGGVEAGALTRPKRFFGSARNIEGGGSLTILGTALVDTGSKMDEVIFEEFKGTGNMELDLDRDLANKRIFPAINFERSGTRKEELLYHPDEMAKIYALRRAMKGVPSVEAMEMLINRVKKTKTNAEFLVTLSR